MADDSNGMDTSTGNDDDRKLFAGGLAQEATEKDITDYFGKFGEVASVNLKMDQMTGRSRGFAFVVFKEVDTLTAVLNQDHAIKGKKVAVKKVLAFYQRNSFFICFTRYRVFQLKEPEREELRDHSVLVPFLT